MTRLNVRNRTLAQLTFWGGRSRRRLKKILAFRLLVAGVVCLCLFQFPVNANPTISHPDEVSLRAAVIVGVLRYTQLSLAADKQVINLCGIGEPISAPKLSSVAADLTVGKRNLAYFTLTSLTQVGPQQCDVLIAGSAQDVTQLNYDSVAALTVCDGCEDGLKNTVIELVRIKNKIRFNVNLVLAEHLKVKFSSSLLELANQIEGMKNAN